MNNLFGWANGSTDESNIQMTGFELLRIFTYTKTRMLFILLIICNLLDSSLVQIRLVINGKLANVLIKSNYDTPDDFIDAINNISALMLLSIVARFLLNAIDATLTSIYLNRLNKHLRVKVFSRVLDQDITYFDKTLTGVILSRLNDDILNVCDALLDSIFDFLYCFYDFLVGVIICFTQSWKVSIIVMCCFPIYGLSQLIGNNYVNQLYFKYNDKCTKANTKAEEILKCFRTVRPFDAEFREYHDYRHHLFDVHDVINKTALIRSFQKTIEFITHWGMASFILFYTGNQAIEGEIEPGTIVTIMEILDRWYYTISGTFDNLYALKKANISAAKLIEIIEKKPLIEHNEGNEFNGKIKGIIEFKNVTFKYPTRDENALQNLSFKINQGETVALVGESGCGKSTILQLIQRFYDVNEGEILIDGKNLKDLSPHSIRSQISIVQQSPVIFTMSVKDNIRFGKPNGHREEVIHAASVSNAHNFIVKLREGYKTMINQISLSGGQKQRICIARAVMMNAPVMLLDEATAALDTESERLVQNAITKIKNEKKLTSIIVAHRLATVKNATRILVIDKGRIVEEGTHEDLLSQSGVYANLIQNQLL